MASTFNISLCSLIQLQDQFVREQIMPGYRESQAFCVSCKEVEDSGMMDSEAIVELRSTGKLSVIDNIIEIHIIRIHHGLFHEVISRGACRNYLNEEGALRISLPCDIPHLEAQSIPLDGGGYHFTDKTAEGMEISGPYRVVFRTLAGPVSVNAYVPTYK